MYTIPLRIFFDIRIFFWRAKYLLEGESFSPPGSWQDKLFGRQFLPVGTVGKTRRRLLQALSCDGVGLAGDDDDPFGQACEQNVNPLNKFAGA